MFKKFVAKENVSGVTQMKSSAIRGVRAKLIEDYPGLEEFQDVILPKKESYNLVKCHERIEIIAIGGEPVFFRQRDGPYMPTLRLLHKYPTILPWQQVDKGAIRFVLSGANIMCPGLTSAGAKLAPAEEDSIVAIMAEGKTHSLSIGLMKLSSEEIHTVNKGIGIENIHYLNDGLWHMTQIK
ncbi:malignant T-cell-amplified sequence 1 [Strongylocentrotus purpuratus]|uniref:PUA domain-containing protein n=1 Tax=Strongylocentrotus purpuratus TaxID=7668 RepID=A0A7M7HJW0_STRPU|nr:malignant T-cell-amplified sequence 1 [Strongylocentrotus purpuratus]